MKNDDAMIMNKRLYPRWLETLVMIIAFIASSYATFKVMESDTRKNTSDISCQKVEIRQLSDEIIRQGNNIEWIMKGVGRLEQKLEQGNSTRNR